MTALRARPLLLLAAALATAACDREGPATTGAQTVARDEAARQITGTRRTAIAEAVLKVAPAVVTVQTEVVERVQGDPFAYFFGGPRERASAGIGSGFVIRPNGVIVTNAHVVAGATRVVVALRDGTTYPAKIVGIDEANDLAVLDVEASDLPVATLGSSRDLLIGEWAIAIGNPYGFLLGNTEPSVTAGVISGTGRNLVGQGEGAGVYVDMIQTDASINPGNSGGPLVNAVGEVIGVNSSIYSPSGGSIGLGFAIPVDRARRVVEDLLEHGRVRRPWIGIKPRTPQRGDVSRELLSGGVTVEQVVPGSPAARAGIAPGDVLLRSRERVLRNAYDWEAELLELRVGEEAPLTVRTGNRERRVTVRVADLPELSAPRVQVLRELELVDLTAAIRAERSVRSPRGALVFRASERLQREIGLQAGDVIVQINRTPIESAAAVDRAFSALAGRGPIRLFFEREGRVFLTDFIVQ